MSKHARIALVLGARQEWPGLGVDPDPEMLRRYLVD
jgi:hypothetical protein